MMFLSNYRFFDQIVIFNQIALQELIGPVGSHRAYKLLAA